MPVIVRKALLAAWAIFVGGFVIATSVTAAFSWFPDGGLKAVVGLFGVFLGFVVGGGIWNRWSDKIDRPPK